MGSKVAQTDSTEICIVQVLRQNDLGAQRLDPKCLAEFRRRALHQLFSRSGARRNRFHSSPLGRRADSLALLSRLHGYGMRKRATPSPSCEDMSTLSRRPSLRRSLLTLRFES